MAPEIGAIDLGLPVLAADLQPFDAGGHGLTQLMGQDKRRLVLNVQLAGECEHALALHLIAKDGDGEEIASQRQLMPGEQSPGRDRKVLPTGLAAPAQLTCWTSGRVTDRAAACRADGLTIRLGPAQAQEDILDTLFGHPHNLRYAQRA
jgi:hypothetical protein